MTPTDLTRLEELQNFLSGGASSRPTTQGRTSTEERVLSERCPPVPGGTNVEYGGGETDAAPTSGDEE